MNDNFTNYSGNDGAAITMMKYTSCFLIGLRLVHYNVQTKGSAELQKTFTLLNCVVWGMCLGLTMMNWETSKKPNAFVNVGLQILFTAGYAYQYATVKDKTN